MRGIEGKKIRLIMGTKLVRIRGMDGLRIIHENNVQKVSVLLV